MAKLKPLYDIVYKIMMVICKLLLIADIVVVSMTVAGRYVPFIPDPAWTEEITLTLMSYMAVLSAAMAIRRNAHIRMTSLDPYLPKMLIKVLDVVADIAVLILAVIMIVIGWQYATGIGAKGFYPSVPWLSKMYMYLPIPIAGIAMLVFEIEALYRDVMKLTGKEVQ
ncbi:MAG: TRAP transporter small permease [Clostridiales bacterium]|nr:TRAP transporter small permease [Clostridiales bacterium]